MRRLLTKLAHPYATLVLLALLLADTYLISQPQLLGGFSTAGLYVRERVLRQRPARLPFWSPTRTDLLLNPSGDFKVFRPDEDSTQDQVDAAHKQSPGKVIEFHWRPISISHGFWAPITRTERHVLQVYDGNALTPEQRAAARRLFVEQSGAADHLSRADFQTLTTTDIDRTRALPLGYAHNALAIAALILFLVSLRWLPKTPAYIRARLGDHRQARGLCPRCSYNLRGLREPKCPECGTPLGDTLSPPTARVQ